MLVLSPVGGAVLAVAQAAGWDVSLSAGWPDRCGKQPKNERLHDDVCD